MRGLGPGDFEPLLRYDWSPLVAERDTIYLFLVRDHARYCLAAIPRISGDAAAPPEEGPAAGYLVSARSADGRSVFVFHVHVRQELRRRGVGTALVRELERRAAADGVERVWFLAREGTRGFYRSLGYACAGDLLPDRVLRHVERVKRAAVMAKRLAAEDAV